MQNKEINQYDEQGQAHGYWEQRYTISNILGGKGYFVNAERRGYWEFFENTVNNDLYLKRYYAK